MYRIIKVKEFVYCHWFCPFPWPIIAFVQCFM